MLNKCLWCLLFIGSIGFVVTEAAFPALGGQCDPKVKDNCMQNYLTFLHVTNLPFTSDEKELDKLCEKTKSGLNCTANLMHYGDCFSDKDRTLISLYITMAQYMYQMLCVEGGKKGYLREAFLNNSECMSKNKGNFECCAKGTKIPNIPVLKINDDMEARVDLDKQIVGTCCPVSRYLQCTEAVARDTCGDTAANFTAEYVRRAIGEQVQGLCQNMPSYPDPDLNTCVEEAPICAGYRGLPGLWVFVLAAVVIQLSTKWMAIN